MLAQCRAFESDSTESVWTIAGTERHEALWDFLKGDKDLWNLLGYDDKEVVRQAASYIRTHAPTIKQFRTEEPGKITVNGAEITLTPDLIDPPVVFDLKSRERYDYTPQMAAYALYAMEDGFEDSCTVHVLYTIPKFYARKLELTEQSATKIIS